MIQAGDGPRTDDSKQFEYSQGARARLYVYDRSRGASRYHGFHNRPPLPPCWAPPCVYLCSPCLEQNACCDMVGKVGFMDPYNALLRKRLMLAASIANGIGLLLMIYSCFALSENFDVLKGAAFSTGEVYDRDNSQLIARLYIGLRAVGVEAVNLPDGQAFPGGQANTVIPFDNVCENVGLANYVAEQDCSACQEASSGLVTGTIMGAISILPALFTNVLRMYPNYDVNCQKAFGCVLGFFSLASTLATMAAYSSDCFDSFYEGTVFVGEGTVLGVGGSFSNDEGQPYQTFGFEWSMGGAFAAMTTATVIRFLDVALNAIIPTPSITRDRDEQEAYENQFIGIVTGNEDGFDGEDKPVD